MNLAKAAIQYRVLTWVVTGLLLVLGTQAYLNLGRLEDPEFTVKSALVTTQYPGASSAEVEQEVTELVETAIQEMGQIDYLESQSVQSNSNITVNILDKYDKKTLPQVWDELRRKVGDVQRRLPPGVKPSLVADDYGDVYGILLAITGDNYSYRELEDLADFLKRELLQVKDVAKVIVWGVQPEEISVEISRGRLAQLGISLDQIYDKLSQQNTVQDAGHVRVQEDYLRISPTGEINSVEAIENLLISQKGDQLIFLKDIATVSRTYPEPPKKHLRFNGEKALGLGISTVSGGNVVNMGKAVEAKLNTLKNQIPLGVHIAPIYYQAKSVENAVDGFIVNLLEALVIVVLVLILFMGLRSGMIIGFVLLLTVCATFCLMAYYHIDLQRISLGALIIALGMLVDNAIVVVEGIQVSVEAGKERIQAAIDTVTQTQWPLLGATIIAILAFAAIGVSQDTTGEYLRSLFQVLAISLLASWIIAITVTPLLAVTFLKMGAQAKQPYNNRFFRVYRSALRGLINHAGAAIVALLALLVFSVILFKSLKESFFPDSTAPQFMLHYWLPQGVDIRTTSAELKEIEAYIRAQPGVVSTASFIGDGAPRFMLVYAPEKANYSYGMILVNVDDYRVNAELMPKIESYIRQNFLSANPRLEKIKLGPSGGYPIEVRFSGPQPDTLRLLAEQAKSILRDTGNAKGVRDNWRERVPLIRPEIMHTQAERLGLSRADIARALQTDFDGTVVGVYREEDKLLPIISKRAADERDNVDGLYNTQVWSGLASATIPLAQLVRGFNTTYEDAIIQRRNKSRTITVQAEPITGEASELFERIRPQMEAINLPIGYGLAFGGEYEDSQKAKNALSKNLPMTLVFMVLITIALFNQLKQPLIIWLTVPLAMIGVSIGLFAAGESFGFMALLGFLSLSGMLIKNAIVLIDQMDIERQQHADLQEAIEQASIARVRPVMMAAVTTVLGMLPLLTDIFFRAMAVTIMAGLSFATVLTLFVVPVFYHLLFRRAADKSH